MKKYLFMLLASVCMSANAQNEEFEPYYKYRIQLTDKKNNEYSLKHPEEFLSEKALQRRKKCKAKLNQTDLPVTKAYVEAISNTGVKVLLTSKWNNTVLVQVSDTSLISNVTALPFVSSARKVATYTKPPRVDKMAAVRKTILSAKSDTIAEGLPYGNATSQIVQLNGDKLHQQGFKGEGMTIAVVDAGFFNADIIPNLSGINILGTHDFVGGSDDIYAENSHGMMVLSCIGAKAQGIQVGTAPEASFWLLRSEDANSEQIVEEDYWCSAVEFADSVGVDVINASLGYVGFDDPADKIEYWQLDGKTHINSRSASMLASKGIILCNSAGNSGNDQWKLIGTPADASDILAVGAVDESGKNTVFSSIGNVMGSRIKPDVCAQGGASGVMGVTGKTSKANGTSFSSPILTGMVACLWQALPNLNAYQIMDLVRKSGNNAEHPDNIYGHGIPDFQKALELGKKLK
ncbi:MAG: S8 family serine peptidase [Bacteroidaceae bacterium]|nr:S8 family serine peptidase [Bacteroidaceae bacterium]